ncbi:MAG: phosphoglycerate kinase [Chitinophagales bacterium]|jgi:phosphoglycerate kinase|nr:phosphoglycerate kinase [Sphingobacteriales bacterium]
MVHIESFNFKNFRALIRVDFNVPLNEKFEITDDTRIQASLPTINKVLKDGGAAIIMTHFGRPKSNLQSVKLGAEEKYSTRHLVPHLSKLLGREVLFADDCGSENAYKMAKTIKAGEVLLLENTRFYEEETKGDVEFAQMLATLGDVYINDAFGSAHRAHASTTQVADSFSSDKKMFGYLMDAEVSNAEKVLHQSEKPFTAIVGGAKVSDKILILENLLNIANDVIIGGGMAYTFFKAQGGQIGKSLVEEDKLDLAISLLAKAKEKGVNIHLPVDSIVADNFSNDANIKTTDSNKIEDGWMGLDIGPRAIEAFSQVILKSKTILWNGPMGVFEMTNFSKGTETIAKKVAEATGHGAFSLIGGGDSVAAINQFKLNDQVSFISTGGGAMLEYFEGKKLPGIEAIKLDSEV